MAEESTETEQKTPEAQDAELLAAVSEAIDAETPEELREPKEEDAGDDTDTRSEDDAAGETGGEGADGTDGADKGDPDGASAPDPAGKDAGKDEPDVVNDPIPEDIKGRTRERMDGLISRVKETSTERDRFRTERDELLGAITETGASPEQFGQTLEFLKQLNSTSPAEKKKALAFMRTQLDTLSTELGEPVPGVDLLAKHQDLKDEVESGDLSRERALEIAAARNARAASDARATRTETTTNERAQYTAAVNQAKADLNTLETTLQSDPDYARKKALLLPTLQPIMASVHPSKWAATFAEAYKNFKLPAAAKPNGKGQQPLRARQPAGQSQKEPGSLEEAINAGIERASGR